MCLLFSCLLRTLKHAWSFTFYLRWISTTRVIIGLHPKNILIWAASSVHPAVASFSWPFNLYLRLSHLLNQYSNIFQYKGRNPHDIQPSVRHEVGSGFPRQYLGMITINANCICVKINVHDKKLKQDQINATRSVIYQLVTAGVQRTTETMCFVYNQICILMR